MFYIFICPNSVKDYLFIGLIYQLIYIWKLAEENHFDIQDAACQETYVCEGSENASVDIKDSSIEQSKDVIGISSQNQGKYNCIC